MLMFNIIVKTFKTFIIKNLQRNISLFKSRSSTKNLKLMILVNSLLFVGHCLN